MFRQAHHLDLLVADRDTGRFQLTRWLLAPGQTTVCAENILEHAHDEMQDLRDECTETVQFDTIVGHPGGCILAGAIRRAF